MKLEIPIIVGFDDLESLLDDIKKLQTYKLSEGAEEVLVDIEDVAEVLMKHVKAKKSVKGDLISRADALSCFYDWIDSHGDVHTADEMPEYQRIEQLPSAQSEIIRCKDCKHWREGTAFSYCDKLYGMGVLDALDYMVAEDDYCSMAERRTDEE